MEFRTFKAMKCYQNEHKCHALCGTFDKGMMLLKARIASNYSCVELQWALDQTQCNPIPTNMQNIATSAIACDSISKRNTHKITIIVYNAMVCGNVYYIYWFFCTVCFSLTFQFFRALLCSAVWIHLFYKRRTTRDCGRCEHKIRCGMCSVMLITTKLFSMELKHSLRCVYWMCDSIWWRRSKQSTIHSVIHFACWHLSVTFDWNSVC